MLKTTVSKNIKIVNHQAFTIMHSDTKATALITQQLTSQPIFVFFNSSVAKTKVYCHRTTVRYITPSLPTHALHLENTRNHLHKPKTFLSQSHSSWECSRGLSRQASPQPTQGSYHPWAPQGMETAKPTAHKFHTQPFNNKQNCINWSLVLQCTDYFRQMSHEEAFTCNSAMLPTQCRQQAALPGGVGELKHKAHLLINSCQLVKQQD